MQTKIDAFCSYEDSNARHDGHGRSSVVTHLKKLKIHIGKICDHLTKQIKIFPMKTHTALEVAERCLEYCLMFGIPDVVLTDQGSNFTSKVIEILWERLDLHTLRTTAYHPKQTVSSNDLTEQLKPAFTISLNKNFTNTIHE